MTSNRDDANVKLIWYDRKRWLEKRTMLKMTIKDDDDMFTTRVTSHLMCIMWPYQLNTEIDYAGNNTELSYISTIWEVDSPNRWELIDGFPQDIKWHPQRVIILFRDWVWFLGDCCICIYYTYIPISQKISHVFISHHKLHKSVTSFLIQNSSDINWDTETVIYMNSRPPTSLHNHSVLSFSLGKMQYSVFSPGLIVATTDFVYLGS